MTITELYADMRLMAEWYKAVDDESKFQEANKPQQLPPDTLRPQRLR